MTNSNGLHRHASPCRWTRESVDKAYQLLNLTLPPRTLACAGRALVHITVWRNRWCRESRGRVSRTSNLRDATRAHAFRVHAQGGTAIPLPLNYDVYTSDSKLYAGTCGRFHIRRTHLREISNNIRRWRSRRWSSILKLRLIPSGEYMHFIRQSASHCVRKGTSDLRSRICNDVNVSRFDRSVRKPVRLKNYADVIRAMNETKYQQVVQVEDQLHASRGSAVFVHAYIRRTSKWQNGIFNNARN